MPNLYRVRYELGGATGCIRAGDREEADTLADYIRRRNVYGRVWIEGPEWEAVYRGAKHLEDDPCPLVSGGVEFAGQQP